MGELADTAPETAHHTQHTNHGDTTLHTNTALHRYNVRRSPLYIALADSQLQVVTWLATEPPRIHVKRVSHQVEWVNYSKRTIIDKNAGLSELFSFIFVGKMCVFVSRPTKIVIFLKGKR